MNNKKSMIDEIQKLNPNKTYPYQSGVTFKNFKLKKDLNQILKVLKQKDYIQIEKWERGSFIDRLNLPWRTQVGWVRVTQPSTKSIQFIRLNNEYIKWNT